MLGQIGWGELILILLIIFLLFGAKRLPEIARAIAKAFKVFKEEIETKDEKKKK